MMQRVSFPLGLDAHVFIFFPSFFLSLLFFLFFPFFFISFFTSFRSCLQNPEVWETL